MFKERPSKKLMERYVRLYVIEEVVLSNAVKLQLPSSMRIHPVVNVSQIVKYREQVKGQKLCSRARGDQAVVEEDCWTW